MALSDQLEQPSTRITGLPCSVAELMHDLADKPEELAALTQMLDGTGPRRFSAAEVTEAVRAEGYRRVGEQQVRRHRRKACRCAR